MIIIVSTNRKMWNLVVIVQKKIVPKSGKKMHINPKKSVLIKFGLWYNVMV